MRPENRTIDEVLAEIGAAAHGNVTWGGMVDAGISEAAIKRRVRRGSLIRQHRGVYRLGHAAPNVEADYMGAVLACGIGAALSGRAAGYLLALLRGQPPPPEVSTPTERRIEGLTTHRCRGLGRRDVITVRAIHVTSVPWTLVDLAGMLNAHELARACHEAGVRYRTTPRVVEAVLARRPTCRGAGALRAVMRGDVQVSLSELERALLELLRRLGLPLPITNRVAGGRRVDCRWPEYSLTVELDSYRFHNSRYAWEQDRQRERAARARRDKFRRFTWFDIVEDPRPTERELRRLLSVKRPG